jgi:serpin B
MLPLTTDFEPENNELLKTANAVFVQPEMKLKNGYLADCERRKAEVYSQRITAEAVNNWASEHTNGRINDVLQEPVPPELKMLVANAIWFKADWVQQFEANSTFDGTFYPSAGEPYTVKMMAQTAYFDYAEDADAQVLTMPYRPSKDGKRYVMDIVLPRESSSVKPVLKTLSVKKMREWGEKKQNKKVNVWFPKLEIEYERELNGDLMALGMSRAFSIQQADFSKMTDEKLNVGMVKQNSFLRIDELGTEAAAVTVVHLLAGALPIQEEIVDFHVNRPYIVIIREKMSNIVLFIGKIEKVEL